MSDNKICGLCPFKNGQHSEGCPAVHPLASEEHTTLMIQWAAGKTCALEEDELPPSATATMRLGYDNGVRTLPELDAAMARSRLPPGYEPGV